MLVTETVGGFTICNMIASLDAPLFTSIVYKPAEVFAAGENTIREYRVPVSVVRVVTDAAESCEPSK